MKMTLIENSTNKVVFAEIMEDESFKSEDPNIGVNDPCYAIFRFQHGEAPLPNVNETAKLLAWYDQICESDSLDQDSPGERMIGKQFNVLCWKNTECDDCENAKAGVQYVAEIEDYHGFGADGFVIKELGMNVDTAVFALNHFIIA